MDAHTLTRTPRNPTQVIDIALKHAGDAEAAAQAIVKTAYQKGSEGNPYSHTQTHNTQTSTLNPT